MAEIKPRRIFKNNNFFKRKKRKYDKLISNREKMKNLATNASSPPLSIVTKCFFLQDILQGTVLI